MLAALQSRATGAVVTLGAELVDTICARCAASGLRLAPIRRATCSVCGGRLVTLAEHAATADETIAVGPVYMAGPITATPERSIAENVAQAVTALDYLTRRRVAVVCPQLTALSPALDGVPYEDWMSVDFVLLEACVAVLALPAWETSAGTRRELLFAAERQIPVFYRVEQLLAHLGVGARAARPFGAPPRLTT